MTSLDMRILLNDELFERRETLEKTCVSWNTVSDRSLERFQRTDWHDLTVNVKEDGSVGRHQDSQCARRLSHRLKLVFEMDGPGKMRDCRRPGPALPVESRHRLDCDAHARSVIHSHLSFALAASFVCHCMLSVKSSPPCFSATRG